MYTFSLEKHQISIHIKTDLLYVEYSLISIRRSLKIIYLHERDNTAT